MGTGQSQARPSGGPVLGTSSRTDPSRQLGQPRLSGPSGLVYLSRGSAVSYLAVRPRAGGWTSKACRHSEQRLASRSCFPTG